MINRFTFISMNNSVSKELDIVLNKCLDEGVKGIITEGYYDLVVEFNDGTILNTWNGDRYYSWLNSGSIKNSKKDIYYVWGEGRPKKRTMAYFLNELVKLGYEDIK